MATDMMEGPNSTASPVRPRFPQTRWSVVIGAGEADPAALADLCKSYWYPIYAYARSSGKRTEDAEDLTQGFFAKVLATGSLSRAEQSKGRMRTFLLTAFRNFMRDEWRKAQTMKRGGGIPALDIDCASAEASFSVAGSERVTPELEFERSWARELLRQTRDRLRDSYADAGKAAEFALLQDHLEPNGGRPYAELAADLRVKEARIRYLVFKLRQRFSHFLREAVTETVANSEEVDAELAHILRVFSE